MQTPAFSTRLLNSQYSNKHASEIDRIVEAYEAGVPEEEIISYQQRTCDSSNTDEA